MAGAEWWAAGGATVVTLIVRETFSRVKDLLVEGSKIAKDRQEARRLDMDRVATMIQGERDRAVSKSDELWHKLEEMRQGYETRLDDQAEKLFHTQVQLSRAMDQIHRLEDILREMGHPVRAWDGGGDESASIKPHGPPGSAGVKHGDIRVADSPREMEGT